MCLNFRKITLTGDVASADREIAINILGTRETKRIAEGGHTPEEIYNVDESATF